MQQRRSRRAGFTLVEVMVSASLALIGGAGIFSSGIMAAKMARANILNMQARLTADLYLEEMIGGGVPSLLAAANDGTNVVTLGSGRTVDRWVDIIGHDANGTVNTNILNAEYIEIHVTCEYSSVFRDAGRIKETVSSLYLVP